MNQVIFGKPQEVIKLILRYGLENGFHVKKDLANEVAIGQNLNFP